MLFDIDGLRSIVDRTWKSGSDVRCPLPGHKDRNASCSLNRSDDGTYFVARCHACGPARQDELFQTIRRIGGLEKKTNGSQPPTIAEEDVPPLKVKSAPTHIYPYPDEDGNEYWFVHRWDRPDGKVIRPAHMVNGVPIYKAPPGSRPLYRLDLIKQRLNAPVIVCEGEKTADAARERYPSYVCTTWMGGAGATNKTSFAPLYQRDVIVWPDNDESGLRAASEVIDQLRGKVQRLRVMGDFTGMEKADDAADVEWTEPELLARLVDPDKIELPKPVTAVMAQRLNITEMARTKAPAPRFIIPLWLPSRAVTLFSSHGSGGKSQIALHLAICLAAGIPFMNQPIARQYKVAVYSCEDDKQVLHYRLQQICESLGVDMESLADHLIVDDASESDNIMYTDAEDVERRLTAAYRYVEGIVRDEGVEIVMIDNASDVYAAQEINRAQVRHFISRLKRFATAREDGAVLLLAHVNREGTKATASTGQIYSGSTAWHNSVRSRWELVTDAKKKKSEEDDDDVMDVTDVNRSRTLTCVKSNYGPEGHSRKWIWNYKYHVLVPDEPPLRMAVAKQQAQDDEAVLQALREVHALGIRVHAAGRGEYSAQKKLGQSRAFPARLREASFKATISALTALQQAGKVKAVEYREDGKARVRLEPVDAPSAPSASCE